jgi:uncharacterized membrane protein YbaN (DUF454 family)
MMHRAVARMVAGIAFLILGIAGLFLPILQGILFLVIALILLSPYVPALHRLRIRLEVKYPRITTAAHQMKDRIKTVFHRRKID